MMLDCKGFLGNCSEISWQCAKSNIKDLTPSPSPFLGAQERWQRECLSY